MHFSMSIMTYHCMQENVFYMQKTHKNHTIYKNYFVSGFWAVCGCMRVWNTSLEPLRHPYERMIVRFRFARAARPQRAKTSFLLHKTAPNGRFETWNIRTSYRSCQKNEFANMQTHTDKRIHNIDGVLKLSVFRDVVNWCVFVNTYVYK